MGARAARVLTERRRRWRAYLLLARVSNLPTIWSNVLAGTAVSGSAASWPDVVRLSVGVSLLYTAGMFLNDVADRHVDAEHRPDRPIPAGDVTLGAATAVGAVLLAAGETAIVAQPSFAAPLVWSLALVSAILYYDYRHKRDAFGPLVMGACRGLVYCTAAAAVAGTVRPIVLVAAVALALYVLGLTWIAKRLGPSAGATVSILIAGIALVDAVVILASGARPMVALLAAVAFVLTLVFQRAVPGT